MEIQIPEEITLRDLYVLLIQTSDKLCNSIYTIQDDIRALNDSLGNINSRVDLCDERIARLEDNLDDRFKEQEHVLSSLKKDQDFPVEKTLVCFGLPENDDEDIYETVQEMVENGLGLVNVQVERSKRLKSRGNRPGPVKIQLPSLDDKIAALRCKRNLQQTGYTGVYIRSSMSHTDRIVQQNFLTLLKEIPNGNNYMVTSNGKVIEKEQPQEMGAWSRGPP